MELAVIILNWNAAAETIRTVQMVAGWRQIQAAVWVVDNASTDGSADAVAAACPSVRLIRNPANLGYAEGNNCGLRQALKAGSAPILLLNNDAHVSEESINVLYNGLMSAPRLGIAGPLLFDAGQPERLLAAGGRNIAWYINTHRTTVGTGPVQVVDYVPGTVLLARAEVFRQVGLLDADYFFTGEIPDLCRRAAQAGYDTAVFTQARAYHAVGLAAGLRQTLYPYYIVRNRFLFIRKFYPRLRYPLYAFWGTYSLAASFRLARRGQRAAAEAVRLGAVHGVQGKFGPRNEEVLARTARLTGREPA